MRMVVFLTASSGHLLYTDPSQAFLLETPAQQSAATRAIFPPQREQRTGQLEVVEEQLQQGGVVTEVVALQQRPVLLQ